MMRSILHSTSCVVSSSANTARTQLTIAFLTFILLLLGAGASAQTADGCDESLFELICPDNADLDCADGIDPLVAGMPGVIYDEFCFEEPEVTFNDVVTSEEGDCPVMIQRTWIATYLDEVGMCTQLITVNDTEGPELIDFESEISVQCTDLAPEPANYTAVDACSGLEYDVEVFESETGALISSCDLTTAFGVGNDWALWLPVLAANDEVSSAQFNFDENGGTFDQFNDGTAHLYGTVVNDANDNESFVIDLWFNNASDWTDWSSMGRSYKDDLGCAQPDHYLDWTYYTMVDEFSTATGQDDLAGDVLYFYHMPADYYYGFQIGMGANNKNCDFGLSGWFTYEGIVDGETVAGNGDVNVDASCTTIPLTDCPNETEFSYFYRAVDNCGNVTLEEQTISVLDDTPPVFVDFPADLTINCEDYPLEIPVLEATDNCAGDVTITGPFVDIIDGECANSFTVTVAWSAEDDCENQTNEIWTITVVDLEAPVMEGLPADTTVECDAIPAPAVVTASDNCDEDVQVVFSEDNEPGDCESEQWIYRTWTATDDCGNQSTYTQEITVQDTTAPVFDAYDYEMTVECDDYQDIMLTATDNCSEEATVVVTTEMTLSGACMGTIYRVYTATDDCGNSSEAVQYILLTDTTAPELVDVPGDVTLECDQVDAGDEYVFGPGDVFGVDNCGLDVTIDYAEEVIPGDCENAYTVIRTWTATDYCENTSEASQTVTVEDNTDPEFTSFPDDLTVECSDETPEVVQPTASDNCDGDVEISMTTETEEGSCEGESTLFRIFRAMDNCGNEVMAVQTITFVDTTPPVFTLVPGAATYECDEEILVDEAEASDNCGSVSITHLDGEITPGNCADAYSFIRTYTATDDCGNSSTADQLISVEDTTPPVITAEVFLSMPCDMISDEIFASAEDNCDTEVEITFEDFTLSGGCAGNVTRIYTATDNCGNSSTFEQTINLYDEVDPEWTAFPLDGDAPCDEVPGVSEQVDAEDNCDDEVEIAYLGEEILPGNCIGNYTIIRTWTATDDCQNTIQRSQTINVYDLTAPEFDTVPGDITYECDEAIAEVLATADDNCGTVEVTFSDATQAGNCPYNYQIIRTFTATDDCGNAATATQTITVEDSTAPEFTFVPGSATFECDDDIDFGAATAEDNCGTVTITPSDLMFPGDCQGSYTIERTWTAEDECGNVNTATTVITVEDTTPPVFDAVPQIEMPCDEIEDGIFVTASDLCSDEVDITYVDITVSGGCQGVCHPYIHCY